MSENRTFTPETGAEEQNVNELRQVRVDKLKALQSDGCDPFEKTKYEVNASSVAIKRDFEAMEGKTVSVAGRINISFLKSVFISSFYL